MNTTIAIVTEDAGQLERLRDWLGQDNDLRGRVMVEARPPMPGEMGSGTDALLAVVAPGGVAVALVGALFAWLPTRKSRFRVRLVRADGSQVEIETTAVGRITAAQLPAIVDGLATWAAGGALNAAATRAFPQEPQADPGRAEAGRTR